MASFSSPQSLGHLVRPGQQYITVRMTAVIFGVGDEFVRNTIDLLLKLGVMSGDDVLELRPGTRSNRSVREKYRQYRIHRETGLAKLKEYFTPTLSRS